MIYNATTTNPANAIEERGHLGHDRLKIWAAGKCFVPARDGTRKIPKLLRKTVMGKLAHSVLPPGNCSETTIHVELHHECSSRLCLIPSDREQQVY